MDETKSIEMQLIEKIELAIQATLKDAARDVKFSDVSMTMVVGTVATNLQYNLFRELLRMEGRIQ